MIILNYDNITQYKCNHIKRVIIQEKRAKTFGSTYLAKKQNIFVKR